MTAAATYQYPGASPFSDADYEEMDFPPLTIGAVDTGMATDAARRALAGGTSYYEQVKTGGGVGEALYRRGIGEAQRGMQAQAISRGASPATERAAIYSGGQLARQAVSEAAMVRAQELAQAAALRQQAYAASMQMGMQQAELEQQRRIAQAAHYAQMAGLEESGDVAALQSWIGIIGGGAGAAGGAIGAMAASDRRRKEGVRQVTAADADALMRALRAYHYRYDPAMRAIGAPSEERVGVMTQDLERSPAGRPVVRETAWGDAIDSHQAVGLALGLLGRVDERLQRLEDIIDMQRQETRHGRSR